MKKQSICSVLLLLICLSIPLIATAQTLEKISGTEQAGTPGQTLEPFVVEVQDETGDPVTSALFVVQFTVDSEYGTMDPLSVLTGTGRAQSTLTLADNPGVTGFDVTASITNLHETTFTVTVIDLAIPLTKISGDGQQGLPGQALANPFVVEVHEDGLPKPNVTVTFTTLTGGGSLSATTQTTGANGRAASTLTLGAAAGTNTVKASAEGISETVTFTAEAIPPTLTSVSGNNQIAAAGTALENPFVVEVRDGDSNLLEGIVVTFAVLTGGGSLSNTTRTTGANGRAASTLTLGAAPGTNTVEVSVEGASETVTFNAVAPSPTFDLSLPSGISLVHIPLQVSSVNGAARAIESVGDLYDALGGESTVGYLITYDVQTQTWLSYLGSSSQGTTADKTLTDETGILAVMNASASVRLRGNALGTDGTATLPLSRGTNLVGLPLNDSRITRVSDLFALNGIAGNVSAIVVSDNGVFKTVGRAGDDSDLPVTGGQSFILIAATPATVTVSGDGWDNTPSEAMAAPPLATSGIQMPGTTAVLALSGSIVHEVNRINSANLRVIVKNLSTPVKDRESTTGSATSTVIEAIGGTASQVGYHLTVVDIERSRAAAIGDILEISLISPDTSIAVQSLRYTVTAEDVKRRRIQLPALVLQEIPPLETVLLRNYPNPFNPETWIPYRLATDALVALTIYDGNGQLVRTLDMGHQTAAAYESRSKAVYWDGRNDVGESVASGVYFYTLTADDFSATRKMLIIK